MTDALNRRVRGSFLLSDSREPAPAGPTVADRPQGGSIVFRLSWLAWMVFIAAVGMTPQVLAEPTDEPTGSDAGHIEAAPAEVLPREPASVAGVAAPGPVAVVSGPVQTKPVHPSEQPGSGSNPLLQFGILVGASALPASNAGYIGTIPTYIGYTAGEPSNITEGFQTQFSENSQLRPIFGAASELRFTRNLGLEAAFLFRHDRGKFHVLNYDDHIGREYRSISTVEDSWEIPISLKYRFQSTRLRPFVGGGIAFRLPDYGITKARGITFVSGTNIRWTKHWSISPQVRYTYWFLPDWLSSGASGVKRSQVHFLIGLTFGL